MTPELTRLWELFQLPFMQRALLGGILTGLTGGLMGSFTILRQLSFFSDALGHSALLGISLGVVMGLNPTSVLIPFAVVFALSVTYLLEKTQLWTDALLNIIYSSSLALAVIILSFSDSYKGGLTKLLFGDILAVREVHLLMSGVLLVACLLFLGLTLKTQMLLTLYEPMAKAQGVAIQAHRASFIVLLSLVVAIAIQAVGVLLVSAFVVIPACSARLLAQKFSHYIFLSMGIGALSATLGIVVSAWVNSPSGASIVVAQLAVFLLAALFSQTNRSFA